MAAAPEPLRPDLAAICSYLASRPAERAASPEASPAPRGVLAELKDFAAVRALS